MRRYQYVNAERRGSVTIITLNRPEVMNALHYPAHVELEQIFDDFDNDPEQWVGIITGAGDRAFCAGNDLKYQAATGEFKSVSRGFAGLANRFDLNKPLIAAVNGVAMGGGFEIALACDVIIASDNALFALPEPRVGLVALAGGLHRLPRAIGTKRAMDLILTSRRVGAAEAKELGLVSRVVEPKTLMDEALSYAQEICAGSPLAIRASKAAVFQGLEASLADALAGQREYPAIKALLASEDFAEGPRAFSEKRPPVWSGR